MPLSPEGGTIAVDSSPDFPKGPLDSWWTLLPGFWLEPENLNIYHLSSGLYFGFQIYLEFNIITPL